MSASVPAAALIVQLVFQELLGGVISGDSDIVQSPLCHLHKASLMAQLQGVGLGGLGTWWDTKTPRPPESFLGSTPVVFPRPSICMVEMRASSDGFLWGTSN